MVQPQWKTGLCLVLQQLNIELPALATPVLGIYPKELKAGCGRDTFQTGVHISPIHDSQEMQITQMSKE